MVKAKPSHKFPPGPRGNFLFGSLPAIQRHPLKLIIEARNEFGDVVRYGKIPPLNQYWYQVTHPDTIDYVLRQNYQNYPKGGFFDALRLLIGNGLLVSDDALWVQQRKLVQPAFQQARILTLSPNITRAAEELVKRLEYRAVNKQPFDIVEEMRQVALQAVSGILFGSDISDESQQIGQALKTALDYVVYRQFHVANLPLDIPTRRNRAFLAARNLLDEVVNRIIEVRKRQAAGDTPDDVLSLLVVTSKAESDKPMSNRQLRDELITLLIAGHDTTALALTWTIYLLARHHQAELELHAELVNELGGRIPEANDLTKLPYNRMVIEEAMRLYPPVWVMARRSRNDDEINGYYIPANTTITIPQYVTHRHPELWENPESFEPEHFLPAASKTRPRYAYFPFGVGPRQCVGSHLAMLETQLILATIIPRFKFRLVPGYPVELQPSITLRPRNGILMTIEARK
jgi:cytochrome P450